MEAGEGGQAENWSSGQHARQPGTLGWGLRPAWSQSLGTRPRAMAQILSTGVLWQRQQKCFSIFNRFHFHLVINDVKHIFACMLAIFY